jgi:hypothetical protein
LCSGILDVYTAMLDDYTAMPFGASKRKKKGVGTSLRELEELDAGWSTLGGAALDAGGRSGPHWTSDA